MIFTLFMSPLHQAYPDNVDDASMSQDATRFMGEIRQNILYHKIEQFELDDTDTRSISLANYARTDWCFLILKVVGEACVNTAGKDYDGSTDITGVLPVYGTALFPGIAILSSYNVDTFSVESLADDTKVALYAAIAAEDDDARLDSNV